MNKLTLHISRNNATIRADRARSTSSLLEIEQQALVNDFSRQLLTKQAELEDLLDFGADQTTSLRVTSRDFDPKQWVTTVQNLKVEILELEVRHQVAQATYKEWFVDEVTEPVGAISNGPITDAIEG